MQQCVSFVHKIVSGSLQVISDLFVIDYEKTNWDVNVE